MSKTCNPFDVALTFSYMRMLEHSGVLDEVSPEMANKMMEKALEKIGDVSEDRERYFNKRLAIDKAPVFNIVSKDYMNSVRYTEEYKSKKEKNIGKHFSFASLYDVNGKVEESIIHRNTEDGNGYIVPPFKLPKSLHIDYEQRDEGVLTILTPKALMMKARNHLMPLLGFTDDEMTLEDKLERLKSFNIGGILLEKIEIALKELNSDNFNRVANSVFPFSEYKPFLLDEMLEDMVGSSTKFIDTRVSPLRIARKSIEGDFYDFESFKELMRNTLQDYMLQARKKDSALDEATIGQLAKELCNSEEFDLILNQVMEKVTQDNKETYAKLLTSFIEFGKLKEFKKKERGELLPIIEDIISDVAKDDTIEVDVINTDPKLKSIPMVPYSSTTEVVAGHFGISLDSPTKEDPCRKVTIPLSVEKITYTSKLAPKAKGAITIHSISEEDNNKNLLVKNAKRNTTSKSVKIHQNFASDFDTKLYGVPSNGTRRSLGIDEADNGIGGELGNIYTIYFNQEGKTIFVVTGTPGNGEKIIKVLKLGGNMSLEAIDENTNEFKKLYGVNEIKSYFVAMLLVGIKQDENFKERVKEIYQDFKDIRGNSAAKGGSSKVDVENNQAAFISKITKDILEKLESLELLDTEFVGSINSGKIEKEMSVFLNAVRIQEGKSSSISDFSLLAEAGVMNSTNNDLVKSLPKISSIKSFAEATYAIVGKSAICSTATGLKKETIFTSSETVSQNFNKRNPTYTSRDFINNNRSGVRVAQAVINEYKRYHFVTESYMMLSNLYENFIKNFLGDNKWNIALREKFIKDIRKDSDMMNGEFGYIFESENFTQGKLFTLFSKGSATSTDGFDYFYKEYLQNNGEFSSLFNASKKEEDILNNKIRVELFKKTLKLFTSFMKEIPSYDASLKAYALSKRDEKKPSLIISDNTQPSPEEYDLTGNSFNYQNSFENSVVGSVNVEEYIVDNLDDYAMPTNIVFSVDIDLCPDDFKDFIEPNEDGKYIPYRYVFSKAAESLVLDVMGSRGNIEVNKESLLQGVGDIEINNRVITQFVNVLNILKASNEITEAYNDKQLSDIEREIYEKELKENITLVVNQSSSSNKQFDVAEAISRIKTPDNVTIHVVKRNVLEATAQIASLSGEVVSVLGHSGSLSRGASFVYLNKFSETLNRLAFTKVKMADPVVGNNTNQATYRGDSPKMEKRYISLFNGGNDGAPLLFGEKGKEFTENIFGEVDWHSSRVEKREELQEKITTLISLDAESGSKILRTLIETMDLDMPYTMTESTRNAKRTEMDIKTFQMIMEGSYEVLNEEDRHNLYMKLPVVDFKSVEIKEPEESYTNTNEVGVDNGSHLSDEEIEESIEAIVEKALPQAPQPQPFGR